MAVDVWNADFLTSSYWLWPVSQAGRDLQGLSQFPDHAILNTIYTRYAGQGAPPLRFVEDTSKVPNQPKCRRSADERYDGLIVTRHEVPTRVGNWHDVLNALCFATFPRAKWALHNRQYRALRQVDPGSDQRWPAARTREQDALTIFDEGGIVVAVSRDNVAKHEADDIDCMHELVMRGDARLVPFGHALLEHFVSQRGRPGGGARVVAVRSSLHSDSALLREIDHALEATLGDDSQFRSPQDGSQRIYLSQQWQPLA